VTLGLVVPIRLEALLVGEGDAHDDRFYPAVADFARLPSRGGIRAPYLGSEAANPPFTGNGPLPAGIHLHWLLPRALRHGHYDEDGLHVPHAPDRWLVTRVLVRHPTATDPQVELRSWVIESNYLDDEPRWSATTVPQRPDVTGGQPYAYLGRVYNYEEWLDHGGEGRYDKDLTAIGYGAADMASYYPNCVNVFGFRDASLGGDDLRHARLSYVVTGWYDLPADDPVRETAILGAENDFGWLFDAPGTESPEYSLFHGAVHGLPWDPAGTYVPDLGAKLVPDVAVGNTPMEGFAALAAERVKGGGVEHPERVLDALQLGLLRGLDQAGGLARLEEGIFGASFDSSPAGTTWDVRAVPGSQPEDNPRNPLADLPAQLGDALADLNTAQRALDRHLAQADSLRAQIFADWQKFMLTMYADPGPGPDANAIYDFVVAEVEQLEETETAAGEIEAQVETLHNAMKAQLDSSTTELVPLPAPRKPMC
jgi:hypothetical protein